jgi:hypothetical protein
VKRRRRKRRKKRRKRRRSKKSPPRRRASISTCSVSAVVNFTASRHSLGKKKHFILCLFSFIISFSIYFMGWRKRERERERREG